MFVGVSSSANVSVCVSVSVSVCFGGEVSAVLYAF